MGKPIEDFLKKKKEEEAKIGIVIEAEKADRVRMQSLDSLPPWVLAAREEEAEKKKLQGGGGGEKGG